MFIKIFYSFTDEFGQMRYISKRWFKKLLNKW
jgi:hypothetical protein